MLNVQKILQPGAEHVVVMRQRRRVRRDNADGPGKAGGTNPGDTGAYSKPQIDASATRPCSGRVVADYPQEPKPVK
jgi:hypothetical protein